MSGPAAAQTVTGPEVPRPGGDGAEAPALAGLVVDGTTGEPLEGATVFLSGFPDLATTNEEGVFVFDALAPGTYQVGFTHPRLEEMGLVSGMPVTAEVPEGGGGVVVLTTPTAEDVLAGTCRAMGFEGGSAVMGRAWADEDGVALPGTEVVLRWEEEGSERRRTAETDADGTYLFCGVPPAGTVTLTPSFLGRRGRTEAVTMDGAPGVIQDLTLALPTPAETAAAPPRGRLEIRVEGGGTAGDREAVRVEGRLVDQEDGRPVVAALVRLLEGGQEAATDESGRFTFRNVTPGEDELEVRHIAYGTRSEAVRIEAGPVVHATVTIPPQPIALEGITVRARRRSPAEEARRRSGTRLNVMTREEIEARENIAQHVGQLVHGRFPGIHVVEFPGSVCISSLRGSDGCALVIVDNMPFSDESAAETARMIPPHDIESVEFIHGVQAMVRYGPRARNGALIIYTRGNGPYAERRP